MSLIREQWFWLVVIILVLIGAALSMTFAGHLTGGDTVKFFGGPIGVFVGYLIGRSKKQ